MKIKFQKQEMDKLLRKECSTTEGVIYQQIAIQLYEELNKKGQNAPINNK